MIERLCEECDKPVTGKLFKGLCRSCYDRARVTTVVSIPKKLQPLFTEYMSDRDDTAKCIIELVQMGLVSWKHGKMYRMVPAGMQ